ncbi:conjugal transfer protein [Orientia tsutsugamushi]|nr:conjugal transfer protein [Orientia tsutsugamushi]
MLLLLFLLLLLILLLFFLNHINILLPYFLSLLIFSLLYLFFSHNVISFLIYAMCNKTLCINVVGPIFSFS